MSTSILTARHLSKTFAGTPPVNILYDLSLEIHAGESVAIVGVSGSGKSTLLQILGLLDIPSAGQLLHRGQVIPSQEMPRWRNREIGFVFQHCHLLEDSSPLANVLMPAAIGRWPEGKEEAQRRARQLLEIVELSHRLHLPCRLLSGGERQRVALARAMMNRPTLLLADEPSGNLDQRTGQHIQELLLRQVSPQGALCVVTHDLELARRCHRALRLVDGALEPADLSTVR
jgi:lipoprotein-releasing system ATP-binding protein